MIKLACLVCLSAFLSFLVLLVSHFIEQKLYGQYSSPFECGFTSVSEGRSSVSVQFYLVSMIFLVFDVELILLFPYAFTSLEATYIKGLGVMLVFFVALSLGAIYEWMNGMLDWVKF